MTENVAFFLALAVMLIIGICIGCYIGSRIAKPNVSRLADEHYPYHDIWHRIETTDLFTYDEKLLLGVMIEDFKDGSKPDLIFLSCGSKETPDRINESVSSLQAAGYNAVAHVSEGTAHEFLTWRRALYHMAQLLFK